MIQLARALLTIDETSTSGVGTVIWNDQDPEQPPTIRLLNTSTNSIVEIVARRAAIFDGLPGQGKRAAVYVQADSDDIAKI